MIGRKFGCAAPRRRSPRTGSATGAAAGFVTTFIDGAGYHSGARAASARAGRRSNRRGPAPVCKGVEPSAQAAPRAVWLAERSLAIRFPFPPWG
jgi:hypothetical protein